MAANKSMIVLNDGVFRHLAFSIVLQLLPLQLLHSIVSKSMSQSGNWREERKEVEARLGT